MGKYSKVEKEKRKAKREVKSAPLITLIEKEDLQAQEKHGVIIPYQQRLLNVRRKHDEEVATAQIKLSIIVIATSSKIAKILVKAAILAKAVPTKLTSTPAKLVSTPVKSAKIPRSKRVSTKILDISSDDSGKAPILKRKLAVAISSEGTPSKSSRPAKKTKLDSSSNEELVKTLVKSEVANTIFGDTTDEEMSPTIKAARNLFNDTDEEVPAVTEEVIAAESSTGNAGQAFLDGERLVGDSPINLRRYVCDYLARYYKRFDAIATTYLVAKGKKGRGSRTKGKAVDTDSAPLLLREQVATTDALRDVAN
ncbi:hypothetical protein EG327_010438 [Venturia inaequalis]|uniref:Uncharacterized protein n=1 Tax=Venturia inaequalis TaxID=5025 RepID=A0A8H3UJN0_VENIN|nr:hypothetical protein EG327_010438 [Venturia inaequalis]